MLNTLPKMLTCATPPQEQAFIEDALEIWRARNLHRHPPEALETAVRTVSGIYRDLLASDCQSDGRPFPLAGSSYALRRVLGALMKVSLSFAGSGIDQASVHAGFTHPDRVAIIWRPDR